MKEHNGFVALIYAVRYPVLGRLLGRLSFVLCVLCVPSLCIAIWFREYNYLTSFAVIMALLAAIARLTRKLPDPHHLLRSEGFLITCAAFTLTPVLLAVALWPTNLPYADRFFETVSAVTTTGLSTTQQLDNQDKTFLFTRSWMQWYGGLGIVVLSVIFLMPRSQAAFQLLDAPEGQGFISTATAYARRIFMVYLVLTAFAIGICWICFADFFSGMCHGFSAISTGGFATRDDSLTSLNYGAQLGVALVCVMGAISLAIYLRGWRRSWRQIISNQELKLFLVLLILLCTGLVITGWLQYGFDIEKAIEAGVIMGFSALSTAGFANLNVADLTAAYKLILIVAMFVGGCTGSTAGGFKVYRLLVLWQLLLATLRKASATQHAVIEPRVQGHPLAPDQIQLVMLTGSLLVVLCLLSWLAFLMYDYAPIDALFEVVSAAGTVGLSSGITAPDLPLFLKLVLCINMIAGRVEIIALVCLLYPGLWLGRRNPAL